jgi:rhamnosyltransferase subunit B
MHSNANRRIVITTFGSFGDIHPYIPIALELKSRGHRPVIASLAFYKEKFEALGIEFHPIRPDMGSPAENPEMLKRAMDRKTGTEYIFKELLMPSIRQSYEDILEVSRGADLLITHPITLAAPIVANVLKIPWVSTVLAPTSFFSIYDPPATPAGKFFDSTVRLNPVIAKVLFALVKLKLKSWIKPLYALREEVGLAPGEHPVFEGQHSPEMVLALFSKVMADPQRDWPPNTVVTGFPFFDQRDALGTPRELAAFLEQGPPPIVFTLGSSAVWTAGDFYHQSLKAAVRLGSRAVLLRGERELDLPPLPPEVASFDYAPYSEIFPRAKAVVHQGGVGTTAQALRAGVPMLVVPFSHDQPDNAARMVRLGVGRQIQRSEYNSETAERELRLLLNEKRYAQRASEVSQIVKSENGAMTACDSIEQRMFGVTQGWPELAAK